MAEGPNIGPIATTVTSPPYNVGIDYGTSVDDVASGEDYRDLADAACAVAASATVTGGRAGSI